MGALKSVLKAVEEYKLEAEYPRETLVKRIAQLEQKKADKKQTATAAAASNSKPQQQQSNKRLRPSSATSEAVIAAANPYPPLIQTQPQVGLAYRAPHMGVAGPYGLAATDSVYNHGGPSSVYNHGGPGLSGTTMGLGGTRGPPRSYYPPEPLVGNSSLYDRPVTYNEYSLSGLPSSYGSSRYP